MQQFTKNWLCIILFIIISIFVYLDYIQQKQTQLMRKKFDIKMENLIRNQQKRDSIEKVFEKKIEKILKSKEELERAMSHS